MLRFQADAELNHVIVLAVLRREPRVELQSASAAGLRGMKDPEVLQLAADQQRILVSHDQTTMPRHFAELIVSRRSPGVLIIPQHLSPPARPTS